MDHVAILRKAVISKKDNLLQDILSGSKTIESRWYVNKVSPWNKIKKGDVVYFKESGSFVVACSEVSKVLQFENLNEGLVREIIQTYGSKLAPSATTEDLKKWRGNLDKKRYCILIFLSNVQKVTPFSIDKTGYGISSAWLAVGNIDSVKRN